VLRKSAQYSVVRLHFASKLLGDHANPDLESSRDSRFMTSIDTHYCFEMAQPSVIIVAGMLYP
jgi:hypothetical protein